MSKADLSTMQPDTFQLKSSIAHANEYIATDFIEKNQFIIVRTGAIIKEYIDSEGTASLVDIYFPGDIIAGNPEIAMSYSMRLKSVETSSLCYLNTYIFDTHHHLYTGFLKIRLKNLEESNAFKQLLLTYKDPIKRVLLFILTIVKKKHVFLCDDIEIKINLSRKQIGTYLGLAEETVIRSLRFLSELGLLHVNSKNFIIPQYKKLVQYYKISNTCDPAETSKTDKTH
ncbi:Crp/Fnr family transcriptional regulator [Legionella worsleiensis]|nr:Crp/Fnr family transcriptional regulator [Legionella worsleiensis]